MQQRLADADIGVSKLYVFPDDTYAYMVCRMLNALNQVRPLVQGHCPLLEMQSFGDAMMKFMFGHCQRCMIDGWQIRILDHVFQIHVAEQRNLLLDGLGQRFVATRYNDIGLDTNTTELFDRVLGRFGFEFVRCGQPWEQRDMHEERVFAGQFVLHLAQGFQKRQTFDISDSSADLNHSNVGVALFQWTSDELLNLVGDMWNDLNGMAQILPASLLTDDVPIDLSCGDVVGGRQFFI